jgi:HD-GYP domain-containing protein (c-di-GMP phosphodiesterase class II)
VEKLISIEQLKPGMYLVSLDKSWWQTPFLFHRRLIRRVQEIALLKQIGVREVSIDPERGEDIESSPRAISSPSRDEQKAAQEQLPSFPADPQSLTRAELEAMLCDLALFPRKSDVLRFAQHYHAPVSTHSSREEIIQACLHTIHDIPRGAILLRSLTEELPTARSVRAAAYANVHRIFEGVATGVPIDDPLVRETVNRLMKSILRCPEASLLLLQLRQVDATLFTHAVNVCVITLVVGKELSVARDRLFGFGIGALLHDVGQMRLPQNLVRKTGRYTDHDRRLMRAHAQLGLALLDRSGHFPEEARRIVAEHHERADGSGYPIGLTKTQLGVSSQIVGIIDVYDTMVSDRGGNPALPPTQALKELYQLGGMGQFDHEWIERVIHSLNVYPVGTLVELTTGEWGIVIATTPANPIKPIVKLIRDSEHRSYVNSPILDLAAVQPGATVRVVSRVLDPVRENVDLAEFLEQKVGCANGRKESSIR